MQQPTFHQFLTSSLAVKIHIIALLDVVTFALTTQWENPPSRAIVCAHIYGLFFLYPSFLMLFWWQKVKEVQKAGGHWSDQGTSSEKVRRARVLSRIWVVLVVAGGGFWLIDAGLHGLRIRSMPSQYLGGAMLVFCAVAIGSKRIWRGGPLDPDDDPN